jgi:glycosyltransferase involved in cell wall biosynthesis
LDILYDESVPKICIIGPSTKYFSGISAYTIRLANALSGSNCVSVLLLRNLLPRFLYPGKHQVNRRDHLIHFQTKIKTYDGLDWNSPLSWAGAYRFLKNERPDVIIMQWWSSSVAHLELLLALANRCKIKSNLILEMHEILDPLEASNVLVRFYSKAAGQLIMRNVDTFIVHSTEVKEQARQTYSLNDSRVFVIPHGVYDSYFREQDSEAAKNQLGAGGKFVVLYFGLIRRYKGIPCLVDAFGRLPPSIASDSKLIIAGEDWGDEKGLEDLVRSSPYSERIALRREFVPESDVSRYFSAADVVVLPYTRTSGSGVASLAMAYGKPVIISDLEGIRYSLQDYGGTIFVPAGDASHLAARIADVYAQYKAGRRASYAVPPQLTWPHLVSQYEEIINRFKR